MDRESKTRSLYFPKQITDAMNTIFGYPLTILEAPMGYGKTTAVREYLNNTDANVLWQRVYDSSITGFWSGFCQLFTKLDADRSRSLAQLGFPNDSVSLQEALRLIEEIELTQKSVLVIDDYHLLSKAEVSRFIESLVINEIDNLHIVLSARYVEFFNINELYLKGYLSHITNENFELMPNDIKKYYKLCGIVLKDTEANQLYAITEGWISALYLLMINYQEKGNIITTDNISKLVESAIYNLFPNEIKDLLLRLSIFDSFTTEQANHMSGNEKVNNLLNEITRRNAFVHYDLNTKAYQVHSIFSSFLKEIFENKDVNYRIEIHKKAGHWCMENGEYLTAMHYFYAAGDFENLLQVVELDKTNNFVSEQKDLFIKYFEECPDHIKQRHPIALLVYAMGLMTFNERILFEKVCGELSAIIKSNSLDADTINSLMGELELLRSFTKYNNIMGMSEHHQKACELLKDSSSFMETKGSWTFGSPSVLYMFYRESGKLEQEVQEMKEAMPYYYRLTSGHGTGAEYVMEAEWHFNQGDFENAEIAAHKAFYSARGALQPNIVICVLFLQVRLALIKGDYTYTLQLFDMMHKEIEQKKCYVLIHTIDMCTGFMNICLQQRDKIPEWLAEGDFNSNRLFFPARAFSNIIYGRVLLLKGEYLKLLGIAGQFMGIASVFPNLLATIYTTIYIAVANEKISRKDEASEVLKQALTMAMPDKLYMPFVENCDYIKPLLETLYYQGIYREDIAKILELYEPYQKAVEQINKIQTTGNKPKLTKREIEIAQLAAEGFSNKGIGERLFISQNTVKTQLKSVFEKLGINSRSLLKQYLD